MRIIHRISGAGSLGRPRLAALYEWGGGYLAREVKARAPSAWTFATDAAHATKIVALSPIWKHAVRCPDPYLEATRHWVTRRLSPDCSRIELADLPKKRHEIALFLAMGWEIANVHLGSITEAIVRTSKQVTATLVARSLRNHPVGRRHGPPGMETANASVSVSCPRGSTLRGFRERESRRRN